MYVKALKNVSYNITAGRVYEVVKIHRIDDIPTGIIVEDNHGRDFFLYFYEVREQRVYNA